MTIGLDVRPFETVTALAMDRADILIIGGGIAGASLGAHLAAGQRVMVAEAESQPGYHSTGRSAALWHEGYGGPMIAPLTRASFAFLDSPPADVAERSFLTPRSALHLARAGEQVVLVDGVAGQAVDRAGLDALVPGLKPQWTHGTIEPGMFEIDVAALHAAFLGAIRRRGGQVATRVRFESARREGDYWVAMFEDGSTIEAGMLVNAAGAWADEVASGCGVRPMHIAPKRRTMVQLRVGRESGLPDNLSELPVVFDAGGGFYFKGESGHSLWLSPQDEVDGPACDAAPEEIDMAVAIDRFEQAVDWSVVRIERSWAGLRSFAPDRLPVYGFDPRQPAFFWCAGQGGFGIQTAPAAGALCAAMIEGRMPEVDPAPYDPARFVESDFEASGITR